MAAKTDGVIPASQRPDGTWRKEIRVKAGYIPPDEAVRYQSRGKEWASSASKLPPGMTKNVTFDKQSVPEVKKTKNQKKNERKKQKKSEQAMAKPEDADNEDADKANLESKLAGLNVKSTEAPLEEITQTASKDTITKKIKGLRKKLRQIEELETKLKSGQVTELTREQKEKVSKKGDIADELEELELDLKLCD